MAQRRDGARYLPGEGHHPRWALPIASFGQCGNGGVDPGEDCDTGTVSAVCGADCQTEQCAGDCGDDGDVDIGEVLTMVQVALGVPLDPGCPGGDVDADDRISVDEIIKAGRHIASGCR